MVEDLDDDRHLVIKESQLEGLKARLARVSSPLSYLGGILGEGGRLLMVLGWVVGAG